MLPHYSPLFREAARVRCIRYDDTGNECIVMYYFLLLGLLYNLTESYDCAFYFAASLFLMGGAVMALPVLKFHKADPGRPIHATRSTSTIETQTFSDEDKFLTD